MGLVGVGLCGLGLRRYAESMAGLRIAALRDTDPTQLAGAGEALELDSDHLYAD